MSCPLCGDCCGDRCTRALEARVAALEAQVDKLVYGPGWAAECRTAGAVGLPYPSWESYLREAKAGR